ncbi:unnamed protein product [Chrysoparadoxa australica]
MPFGKAKKPSGAAPSPITNAAGSGGNRGAVPADAAPNELLAAIRGAGGGGLRKTNTVDKTAPRGVGGIVSSSPGTGGASSASAPTKPAVGGGGGIMGEWQQAHRLPSGLLTPLPAHPITAGELAAKMAQRQAASGSAGAGAGGAPSGRPAPSAAPPAVPGAGVNSGLAAALAARRAASPKSAPPPVPMPQATSAPPPVPVFSKVTPAAASTPTPSVSNGNATVERRLDDIEVSVIGEAWPAGGCLLVTCLRTEHTYWLWLGIPSQTLPNHATSFFAKAKLDKIIALLNSR